MKFLKALFFVLVCISVTAAFWVFKDLLFPFVTSKAFFFRIAIELAAPIYAFLLVMDKDLRPNLKNPLNLFVLAFVVLNFASAFSGVNVTRSLWGNFERMGGAYYIAHLTALYFYILALGQMGSWYLKWFLNVLLFVALVVAANGISGWLGGPTLVLDPTLPTRISSTLGNPIYVGSFLIIPFFFFLFLGHQSRHHGKLVISYLFSAFSLFAIYLSGTRGAVIGILGGAFLGSLVYLFFQTNKKIKLYGFGLVGFFAALGIFLFVYHTKLPQGSNIRRIFTLTDSNTFSRLLQWQVALRGFQDRPILGTGPENYYIIANQYYNPKIADYDPSWFDKPHNYLLEILVTDGVLGFLAYAGILAYLVYAIYKGFKSDLYGLIEFSFLIAALVSYQIQNLFVFDTVPASLMFFSFAGFAAYIFHLSEKEEVNPKKKKEERQDYAFGISVFILTFCVMAYAQYATNYMPIRAGVNVNYGYAYMSVDWNKAIEYFNTAITLPFNFDKTETASKFGDFGMAAARGSNDQNREQALKILQQSTNYLQKVVEEQPDNPILWQRLGLGYLYQSVQVGSKVIIDPRTKDAINKAIELAPKRNEASLTLAQIVGLEGDLSGAEKILKEAMENIPSDMNARLQLVNVYRIQNRPEEAVAQMQWLLDHNYRINSYGDIKWFIDYQVSKSQFDKALVLQLKAAEVEPANVNVFIDLVKLYILNGKLNEAQELASKIVKFDSTKQKEINEIFGFIPIPVEAATSTK